MICSTSRTQGKRGTEVGKAPEKCRFNLQDERSPNEEARKSKPRAAVNTGGGIMGYFSFWEKASQWLIKSYWGFPHL